MDSRTVGALVVVVGLVLVLVGALVWTGALGWFGRLPGDVRIENGSTRVYVPIVSMLLLSALLSLLASIVRRFL